MDDRFLSTAQQQSDHTAIIKAVLGHVDA